MPSKKILIISHDKIGAKMAGPGIRYHFMAEYLSDMFDITIGFFDPSYVPDSSFNHKYLTRSIDAYNFENDFKDFDCIISLWLSDSMINYCNLNNKIVIFDIYAPVPVENLSAKLFSHHAITKETDFDFKSSLIMYKKFFENGDLFLYSNERQLDFWIGYIFGALQITPSLYNKRPMYEKFIKAPMGIDTNNKLIHKKPALRNIVGNIKDDDIILLWTGGIWDWFDAVSVIDAMSIIKNMGRNDIKLVFLGTQHPNDSIPKMAEVMKARTQAETKKLLNDTVYFLDGWVDYERRIDYLLESNIAIYAHKPSIETEFSHRTRVLDHFLASLPTIGTRGDYIGDIIESKELGIMVDPLDSKSLAKAIIDCSEPEKLRLLTKNVNKYRNNLGWSNTLKPLKEYLLSNPKKSERLPSSMTPLNKLYLEKIKKTIPKPIKTVIKKGIGILGTK